MIHQALDKLNGKVAIRSKYDNFIGGQWVAPIRGQYFSNITPITGKPVGEIARSTAEDIELALDAAHKAREKWGLTSPAERAKILNRIADRMEENLDLLALAETWDNGKPIRETTRSARRPMPTCRWRSITSVISPPASALRKAPPPSWTAPR